jgi:hypothetical protein
MLSQENRQTRRAAAALARSRAAEREDQRVGWNEKPLLTVPVTGGVLGCSNAKVYDLAVNGLVEMVKLNGRTLVRTESVARLIAQAVPFVPIGQDRRGRARTLSRTADTATACCSRACRSTKASRGRCNSTTPPGRFSQRASRTRCPVARASRLRWGGSGAARRCPQCPHRLRRPRPARDGRRAVGPGAPVCWAAKRSVSLQSATGRTP